MREITSKIKIMTLALVAEFKIAKLKCDAFTPWTPNF